MKDNIRRTLGLAISPLLLACLSACSTGETTTASAPKAAPEGRFPSVEVVNVFEPEGESNVRSSFPLATDSGLIGTEESADIFKTVDGGLSWRKVFDGGTEWGIADVRNYIRGQDGNIYITTTEPATIGRSTDEGETWQLVTTAKASRTVGLVQLDNGAMLVGLRRSQNGKTSLLRSEDYFATDQWIVVSEDEPRQNVTCFGYWGGAEVFAGIGFEGSGKVYKSTDYGLTWSLKADIPEARDVMDFFKAGDDICVLVSGTGSIFKSSDNGESWSKTRQFYPKGFLGQCVPYERDGKAYLLMSATDQSREIYRHLVLISDDLGASWHEWVDLAQEAKGKVKGSNETGGGASNISVLSEDAIVIGVGNHAVQGRAYTLRVGG
ncbi:hypothetical protein G0Q06_13155 [Puniceicoccales bacterium CK1056]|uniref:Photosynthesis system II assembly factor Ycf48/Hcf136-like domain-containing protein n=1 Tax=Oceanipulchritudo coccoides TaxID=2706888 RepID=A0A6B2M5K3_9BACT|nr:sialidase family protein [Oceanipulchritudo coccoides]NDV63407.1 hypothetical protein [Oceanipulchritudo coccoides]